MEQHVYLTSGWWHFLLRLALLVAVNWLSSIFYHWDLHPHGLPRYVWAAQLRNSTIFFVWFSILKVNVTMLWLKSSVFFSQSGKYGIGVPWYFPVTRSFWADMFSCCCKAPKKIGRGLLFTNIMQEQTSTDKSKGTLIHTDVECLILIGLYKHWAVKNFCMSANSFIHS